VSLLYLLIIVSPFVNHPIWSRSEGDLTVIKYLGLVSLLFAVFALLVGAGSRPSFVDTRPGRWCLAFYSIAISSYFWGGGELTLQPTPLTILISMFGLLLVLLIQVSTMERLRRVALVTIGSVTFVSLYVIREYQRILASGESARPGWVTGDANYYTVSAVLCVPLALCFARDTTRPHWERWFSSGCLIIILAAITAAASRGGFLGLLAGLLVALWSSRRRWRNILVIVLLISAFMLIAPSSPLHRLLDPTQGDTEAEANRLSSWRASLTVFTENPLLGVGLGNFKNALTVRDLIAQGYVFLAHNTYLEIAVESGLPGVIVFVGLFVSLWRALTPLAHRTSHHGIWTRDDQLICIIATGLRGGLLAYAVAAFFITAWWQRMLWIVIGLALAVLRLRRSSPVPAADPHRATHQLSMPAFASPVQSTVLVRPQAQSDSSGSQGPRFSR
jgi:O-antigen ligase